MDPQRILCIDDDPDARTLLEIGLSTVDTFDVRIFASVREALARVEDFKPDLLLLDLNMPEMDGRDAITALSEHPDLANCPAILVTAVPASRLTGLQAPENLIGVISKPFNPMRLGDDIRQIHRAGLHRPRG